MFIQRFTLHQQNNDDERYFRRINQAARKKLTPAAVMLAFVERNNELFLIFTKRARHLKHHPSQISFPGGKVEKQDCTIIDTAIRETAEEIGVEIERVIGLLASLSTVSGYMISPVVGFVSSTYQAQLDSNEVELIFEIPLKKLLLPNMLICQHVNIHGQCIPIYGFHHENHLIWGATAQILYGLKQQICFDS